MTTKQQSTMQGLRAELSALHPNVTWFVSYNYYTKLPEIKAVKDGAIDYGMMKYWSGEKEMFCEYNPSSRLSQNGAMLVSNGGAETKLQQVKLSRINFNEYIEFVKANTSYLEMIGA